ncbi:MAG: hypothetical protein JJ934_19070 [Pseudomonadales bacterium]|nr:hypothetical protein [Pseudomonadales bacterium]
MGTVKRKLSLLLLGLFCFDGLSAIADEQQIRNLETALLDADRVQLQFTVTSTGAVETELSGFLIFRGDDEVSLEASGEFAGNEVELKLATMAGEMHYGLRSNPATDAIPSQLKASVLIGLVRMGILHNLAMLSAGAAPDHAEGGVEEWVQINDFSEPDTDAVAFAITIAGQPSGNATLLFESDQLVRRLQTVEFAEGAMQVTEEYRGFSIR